MNDEIKTSAEAMESAALPTGQQVHVAGGATEIQVPAPLAKAAKKKSPAQWAYERLILYIQKFEQALDGDHEVAMGFAGSDAGVMRIEGLGYFDPDILTFFGSDRSGAKTQLVQHVSQMNVLFRAIPKRSADDAPQRIGFRLAQALDETAEETDGDATPDGRDSPAETG